MIKVTLSFILDSMERDHLNCWILLDGKNELARQNDPEVPIEQSLDALRDAVSEMVGDLLTIKASKTGKGATMKTFFLNLSSMHKADRKPVSSPSAASGDLVAQLIELRAEIKLRDYKDQMKAEIDAMKASINGAGEDRIGRYIDMLAPHLAPAINHYLTGGRAPVSQVLNGPGTDDQARLQKALGDLQEADPGFVDVIVSIADMAKHQSEQYFGYRKFLVK